MTPPSPVHIRALDGIRGLSIALVLLYHGWTYRPAADSGALADLGSVIDRVRVIGWAGVDVFFVLSGFLITGILLETKGERHYWRNFLIRRGLRIFPLYYAVLLALLAAGLFLQRTGSVSGAAGELARGVEHIWINFLYLTNFAIAAWGEDKVPLDISWSLAIEEQFYLLYPLVVLLCSRRALALVLVGMVVVAPVCRVLVFHHGAEPVLGPYVLPFCRMDALAVGALVRLALTHPAPLPGLVLLRRLAPGLSVLALIVLMSWSRKDIRFVAVGYTLSAVAAAALLVRVLQGGEGSVLRRFFEGSILAYLGKVSYGVYLFHLIARVVVARGLARVFSAEQIGGTAYCAAQLLGMSLLTLGAATLSFRLFERPLLKLKDRWAPIRPR